MGLFDLVNPKKRAETRLLDQIFNLKFTAKSLNRSAQKCLKDESNLKSKCKLAMKNGNKLSLSCSPPELLSSGRLALPCHNDSKRLRQMLINLIGNACKFTDAGKIHLEVTCAQKNGRDVMVLAVSDTGIGISNQHIAQLFRPFTQVDSSTTRHYGGTGLGLAVTDQFCKLMGGDLEVQSKLGQGSCFTLTIPLEIRDDESPAVTERSKRPNLQKSTRNS